MCGGLVDAEGAEGFSGDDLLSLSIVVEESITSIVVVVVEESEEAGGSRGCRSNTVLKSLCSIFTAVVFELFMEEEEDEEGKGLARLGTSCKLDVVVPPNVASSIQMFGKSSSIRIMAGEKRPRAGRVSSDKKERDSKPPSLLFWLPLLWLPLLWPFLSW